MTAALALGGVGFVLAGLLCLARLALARREQSADEAAVAAIDDLLPQTQCGQCGYPGCRPYAQAVFAGVRADLCAPGGPETADKLRAMLATSAPAGQSPAAGATAAARGAEFASADSNAPGRARLVEPREQVARIAAAACVGCGLCVAACPVDAIAGAPQYLHAVVADHCTGCELCVPACPVDCIGMVAEDAAAAPPGSAAPERGDAERAAMVASIAAAGVVGMGGGGFPTAAKIDAAIAADADWVVGNGMATEPGVSADTALLRARFNDVVTGLRAAGDCLNAPARLVIAVRPGSGLPPPAAEVDLPYPAGEERALVQHLTGRRVPAGGHPTDVGVLVLNVATLAALPEAIQHRRAPATRLATVDGNNLRVRLGTPLTALPGIDPNARLRVNGSLTGRPARPGEAVAATTFAVDVERPALPCVGCGWCEPVCPVDLPAERLHRTFLDGAPAAAALACVECGACAAACPSGIDLVNEFRELKARAGRAQRQRQAALAAKARWLARDARRGAAADAESARRQQRLGAARQW